MLIRALYKSKLEDNLASQLEEASVSFAYEQLKLKYTVPAREATYTPDFQLPGGIVVEAKGWLDTDDRKKMVLVKQSNPEIDIRFVFQGDATKKYIYKGSPTSYAKWCDDHGFPWADRGRIPAEWMKGSEDAT